MLLHCQICIYISQASQGHKILKSRKNLLFGHKFMKQVIESWGSHKKS